MQTSTLSSRRMKIKALMGGARRGTRQQVTKRIAPRDGRKKDPSTGKRPERYQPCGPTDQQVENTWKEMLLHDLPDNTRDFENFMTIHRQVVDIRRERKEHETCMPDGSRTSLSCQCPGYQSNKQRLECRCAGILCYCDQLFQHPVNPGSIVTYLTNVSTVSRQVMSPWNIQEVLVYNRVREYYKAMYGLCKAEDPGAIGVEEAREAFSKLKNSDKAIIVGLYLQTLCGVRFDDLGALRVRHINYSVGCEGPRIRFEVRVSKNGCGPDHTRQVDELLEGCLIPAPEAFMEFMERLVWLKANEPDCEYFCNTSTDKANQALEGAGVRMRTKNFRKHYSARVWAESNGNMQEVARRMGHSSQRSARFYISCLNEPVVEQYRQRERNPQSMTSVQYDTAYVFVEDGDEVLAGKKKLPKTGAAQGKTTKAKTTSVQAKSTKKKKSVPQKKKAPAKKERARSAGSRGKKATLEKKRKL